jgi:FixJ family two-component response regulator
VEPSQPVIAIIDDDASIRRAMARLLHAMSWHAASCASAEAFLQATAQELLHCLVLNQ